MFSSSLSRRTALLGSAALLIRPTLYAKTAAPHRPAAPASTASAPAPVTQPLPHFRLLGDTSLPHRLSFQDTTVGGLSALDYDPVDDLWYTLSDDRSEHDPARFYTFRMSVTAEGLSRPSLQSVVFLRQSDGSTYPSRKQRRTATVQPGTVPDPEGLRFRHDTRTLMWSSEGNTRLGLEPFVREISLGGQHLRHFTMPPQFKITPDTGPRDNLGLEGLALSPDGSTAWASMENALLQDGPEPAANAPGGPCRITSFSTKTGKPLRQIAYVPDAIPDLPFPVGGLAMNGISELLMQTHQHLLVLERSYIVGVGNSLRLYRVNVTEGSDTLGEATLRPGNHTPVTKTLVLNFKDTGLKHLDNTEGMAWGPLVAGRKTLVFVSDDNFNPLQTTQFVAFEVTEN